MGLAPYGKLDQEILADFRSLLKVDGLSIKFLAPAANRGLARPDEKAGTCHPTLRPSK